MKSSVFIALFLFFSHAVAGSRECESVASLAHRVMEARQSGVSMKAAMSITEDPSMDYGLKTLIKNMLINAYERPRFSTDKFKDREISDFEDGYYLACVKS